MKVANTFTRSGRLTAVCDGGLMLAKAAVEIHLSERSCVRRSQISLLSHVLQPATGASHDLLPPASVLDVEFGAVLGALDRHTSAGIALKPRDFRRVLSSANRKVRLTQSDEGRRM